MKDQKTNPNNAKSTKVFILFLLVFIFGDVFFWTHLELTGILLTEQIKYIFTNANFWIFLLIKYISLISIYKYIEIKICSFDGTTESIMLTEKNLKKLEIRLLIYQLCYVVITLLVGAKILINRYSQQFNIPAYGVLSIGSSCISTSFMFMLYMTSLEKWVTSFVPFDLDSKIHLRSASRTVITVEIGFIGFGLSVIGMLIGFPKNLTNTYSYIFIKIFPIVVFDISLVTTAIIHQVNNSSRMIIKIQSCLTYVAKGDYTHRVDELLSREEYGKIALCTNYLIDETKELIFFNSGKCR